MTKFVMRDGHMVSTERAAILDAAAGGAAIEPIDYSQPEPEVQSAPPRTRSERLAAVPAPVAGAALTPQQKRAATLAANRAAKAAAAAEPLRPTNIDPATGETVILKEVIVDGKVTQVPVESAGTEGEAEAAAEATGSEPVEGEQGEGEDPFDAAVEAAAGAGDDAAADAESAVADAG